MTTNFAVDVFALESVAEHVTTVRPIGSRLPDRGAKVTGTFSSTASLALTVSVTRTRLAPFEARTVALALQPSA